MDTVRAGRQRYCIDASPAAVLAIAVATLACFGYAAGELRVYADTLDTPRYAAGAAHVCRITATGGVRCRGANENGELGDGTHRSRLTEVDVAALADRSVRAVSLRAGPHYTCALMSDGSERCWGVTPRA